MIKESRHPLVTSGTALKNADKVLIMLHGRGAGAEDILSLHRLLDLKNTYFIAPQAENSTWYPYSFLAPVEQNQPWLDNSLKVIEDIVTEVKSAGFKSTQVYLLGFSQGACLTLEFAARNAQEFGGVISFTGGLIGNSIDKNKFSGDFKKSRVFIANSDRDPHVPLVRSEESARILESMNADVMLKIYPGMSHTINADEISQVKKFIFN